MSRRISGGSVDFDDTDSQLGDGLTAQDVEKIDQAYERARTARNDKAETVEILKEVEKEKKPKKKTLWLRIKALFGK